MAQFFGKLFFNLENLGISEVYPMETGTINDASVSLASIATNRLALLCPDVICVYATVSDCDIRGDSMVVDSLLNSPGTFGLGAPPYLTYDPHVGLLTRWTDPSGLKRAPRKLKFLPQNLFNSGGVYTPYDEWNTAVQTYFNSIKDSSGIASKNPPEEAHKYTIFGVDTAVVERPCSFKPGRPFGLVPGRRPIR